MHLKQMGGKVIAALYIGSAEAVDLGAHRPVRRYELDMETRLPLA